MALDSNELGEVVADLRGHLEWLRDSGVREVPGGPRPAAAAPGAGAAVRPPAAGRSLRQAVRAAVGAVPEPPAAAAGGSTAPRPGSPSAGPSAARRSLDQIRAELGDCRRCKLAGQRTHLVFGAGNPAANLVFVGEAPGEEEDRQGAPFVGPAGQLLTKMIEAMGYRRDEVYICNVLKCRPPNNRDPEPDEVQACEPFLQAQLASLAPRVVVALGACAAQTLLREATPISRLRGNWRQLGGIRIMPTYHPAYLLHNPSEKRAVWEDLKKVMAELKT